MLKKRYFNKIEIGFFFELFQPTVTRTVNYYMESGHWFLSLYNDNGESKEVKIVTVVNLLVLLLKE
jgi:hypothetical protein